VRSSWVSHSRALALTGTFVVTAPAGKKDQQI
jgi:hypothetical protein